MAYPLKWAGLTQPHSVTKRRKSWEGPGLGKAALQQRLTPKELKLDTAAQAPFSRAMRTFLKENLDRDIWSTIVCPLCQFNLLLYISSESSSSRIPMVNSSKGIYRGGRLVRQTIVPAATFDLRAAINTRCLTPPLLILHFPPPSACPCWLT